MRPSRASPLLPSRRNDSVVLFSLIALCTFSLAADLIGKETRAREKQYDVGHTVSGLGHLVERYVPEFLGVDRSIIGRAEEDDKVLANNAPESLDIEAGESQFWRFPRSALFGPNSQPAPKNETDDDSARELRMRQAQKTVFVTLNTCNQPVPKSSSIPSAPDQLKLYISTSQSNQKPDSNQHNYTVAVDGGYGGINITAGADIYIGVSAPSDGDFSGDYSYEITASIDEYYAKYENSNFTFFIDSDNKSALLYTANTTTLSPTNQKFDKWMNSSLAFSIYVNNQEDPKLLGLHRSMCALKKHAKIQKSTDIASSMTTVADGKPKQQFYVKNLNSSSAYYAIVTIDGANENSEFAGGGNINGGGTTWNITYFSTKSSPNCALIYDLEFCSETAYAVPSNTTNAEDLPNLRAFYDSYAASMNKNFEKSLAQIPCNTTDSARYSLAANCSSCQEAYKKWLCAVTIPRCEDFSSTASYLQPRAVNQSFIEEAYGQKFFKDPALKVNSASIGSRNPRIDQVILPGPYKEILPCEDLCYSLVRNCPAALGFSCPLENHGLNYSYGKPNVTGGSELSCNYPGKYPGAASPLRSLTSFAVTIAGLVSLWTWLA